VYLHRTRFEALLKTQNANLSSGLLLVLFSAFVAYKAYKLGVGNLSTPGPGFMFFSGALLLGVLALHLFLKSLRTHTGGGGEKVRTRAWRILPIFAALLFYVLLFKPLGYLLATFFFLTFLFAARQPGRQRWFLVVGGSVFTSVVTYVVFAKLFALSLPKGIVYF
jgi:putative tricarboxylic transport membrane protein